MTPPDGGRPGKDIPLKDVPGKEVAEVLGRRVAPGHRDRGEFTYTVVEVAGARAGEQRGDRRVRTRLHDGTIAERGRRLGDCRICDRSRSGARLILDDERPLPRSFLLTDAASRGRYWATVVWQKGRDVGVRLVPA